MQTQTCSTCKCTLPIKDFGHAVGHPSRLLKRCKQCSREAYHRQKDRDLAKAHAEAEARRSYQHAVLYATASRDNIFERPIYTGNKTSYYRNDGNKHILSRGF